MDTFIFSPTKVDAYLQPGGMDDAWGTRYIIPESLYREVELTSSEGHRIYGFIIEPDGAARDGVTILYSHGNSDNINRYWCRAELLWEMGYRVFLYDYQGYGRSEGTPSGDACFADGRAALEYVLSHPGVDRERLVYYGWSMGTFITTYLAADSVTPAAILLESPPASASVLVKEGTLFDVPGSMLTGFDFDNVARIGRVGAPVVVMHGMKDEYLPPHRHLNPLIAAASEGGTELTVNWVVDAGHEDVPDVMGAAYDSIVTGFIHRQVTGE